MDLLFSKYASPFLLLDQMIRTQRLAEFIVEFMSMDDEQRTWDFYLHKVFDKSFDDFKQSLTSSASIIPSELQLKTTIKDSKDILNNFIPTEKG